MHAAAELGRQLVELFAAGARKRHGGALSVHRRGDALANAPRSAM